MNEASREWQDQQAALQGRESRSGADRYRVVYEAIARAPRSEPPADFTAGVLARVADWEREDRIERRLLGLFGALLGIGLALYAAPMVFEAMGSGFPADAGGFALLQSPLLWAALAAGATAGILDKLVFARGRGPQAH